MSGTKVPRDPNLSPELRRFLDDLSRLADTLNAAGYATIASPTFTGDPKAPTPSPGDNDTSIATTAYVTAAIAAIPSFSPTRASAGSVGTGTTFTISSIPAHTLAILQLAELSHNSGANQNWQIELSANNGSSWSSALTLTPSAVNSGIVYSDIFIISHDGSFNYQVSWGTFNSASAAALGAQLNAIRISPTGGNFDGGRAYLHTL